ADKFTLKQLNALYERASKDGKEVSGARGLCQKITAYRNVRADPSGSKIGKLEPFAAALRAYIEPSPNKWLFSDESDGFAIPYFVGHIAYSKADPARGRQACVDVRLEAVTRGGSDGRSLSIGMTDLGKTVPEILAAEGLYLETKAAVTAYWEDIELYKKYAPLTGAQFRAVGTGYPESYSSYKDV